jgi:hypothetical protein
MLSFYFPFHQEKYIESNKNILRKADFIKEGRKERKE